jgi:hypothetical protein
MLGFDLDNPVIHKHLGNAYNLAIPGAKVDEIDQLIRYAYESHVPDNLIIGLDLGGFATTSKVGLPGFMTSDTSFGGSTISLLRRLGFALWSADALLGIARIGFQAHSGYLDGSGNRVNRETLKIRGVMGQTRYLEKTTAKRLMREYSVDTYHKSMDALFQMLKYSCAKKVSVKLFVTPLHIRRLLLLRITGYQGLFYDWKRGLTDIVERLKESKCDIDLVDFSGISEYTTNRLSSERRAAESPQWYWESSHFKTSLGDLILRRILGKSDVSRDFGVNLNGEVIENEISKSREELVEYQKNHPQLVNEMRDIVLKASGE